MHLEGTAKWSISMFVGIHPDVVNPCEPKVWPCHPEEVHIRDARMAIPEKLTISGTEFLQEKRLCDARPVFGATLGSNDTGHGGHGGGHGTNGSPGHVQGLSVFSGTPIRVVARSRSGWHRIRGAGHGISLPSDSKNRRVAVARASSSWTRHLEEWRWSR